MNGTNTNPGTELLPLRDLTTTNLNTLPAGTVIRFERGGVWEVTQWKLYSALTRRDAPLTIEAYGNILAPMPEFNFTHTVVGVEFGENFSYVPHHEGYAFKNLRLIGPGQAFGFWGKGDVSDVTVQSCEMRNWNTPVDGQGGDVIHRATRFNVLNNIFQGNHDTGILGRYFDSLFQGNDFSDPNQPANHFVHRMYLSFGDNNVVRGNRGVSVNPARGGTLTFHGRIDTSLIIEDNYFEYGIGPNGEVSEGWTIALSPYVDLLGPGLGNGEPHGFKGVQIRRNRLVNPGTDAIHVQCAPGAIVDSNEVEVTTPRALAAIAYQNDNEVPLNWSGPGTMTNNTARGPAGSSLSFSAPPGSTESNNTVVLE